MPKNSSQAVWQSRAKALAARVNMGWFLEKLSLPLLIAGLVGAVAILLARREFTVFPWQMTLMVTAGVIALVILMSWLFARRFFTTTERALVRVESSMSLNNSLTAARAGVSPWPDAPETIHDGTHWNWRRLVIPPLVTLLLLSAAFLLPVSARVDPDATPPEEPANRQALQASIDELRKDETIDEEYLDEMEKKLEELREQPTEEWFDHSSLEATDTLKDSHEQQLKELERDLKKAERALETLQKHGDQMGQAARENMLDQFDQALENMNNGAMKPNKELMEQLKGMDPGKLANLSPEQLDQLRENMREMAQKMNQANPGQQNPGDNWDDELNQEGGNGDGQDGNGQGQGQGNQPGDGQDGPGKGGINRGPGTAPGVLGAEGEKLETGDLEGMESRDLSNTLPGDLLELEEGEHQIDRSKVGVRGGGEVENLGEGGDLIWKVAPDLNPAEKKALREFFK